MMTLGKNTYYEVEAAAEEGKIHIAEFRFFTAQPEGSYLLVFECEARNKAAYLDLLARILTSFDAHARPLIKHPPRQFKPRGPVA
jgi:hypothetical protein